MKRVLVTGAAGFIGRYCLSPLIACNYEVHCADLTLPQEDNPGVHWHVADLLNPQQVQEVMAQVRPTHLLHLAWYTKHKEYWHSLENLRWIQASLDLLQQFYKYGGRRIVVAGTCAEYDWRYGYCSENVTPLSPATLYGICKHSLQTILTAFAEQTGLSAAWGRIFFLYGPNEHPDRLVSSVIRSLLKNETARCSHGNQIRDFLYVEDVADAFVALLDSEVFGTVNIASGEPRKLKRIIYNIADKLNKYKLIELNALPVSADEAKVLIADISRLTTDVGWSPKLNLDQGLDLTINWLKEQLLG